MNCLFLLSTICVILCPKFKTFSIRCSGNWFCPPNFTENENHLKICQLVSSYYLCIYFLLPRFLGHDSLGSFWGAWSLSFPAQRSRCYGLGCGIGIRIFTLAARILTFCHSPFVGELQSSVASQGLSKQHLIFVILTPSITRSDSLDSSDKAVSARVNWSLTTLNTYRFGHFFSMENPRFAKAMECTSVMQGVRDRDDLAERWWGELYLLFPSLSASGLDSWLPLIQGEKKPGTQGSPGVLLALPGILPGSWVEWGPPSPCPSCCGADRTGARADSRQAIFKKIELCLHFHMSSIKRGWESLAPCSKTSVNSQTKALTRVWGV